MRSIAPSMGARHLENGSATSLVLNSAAACPTARIAPVHPMPLIYPRCRSIMMRQHGRAPSGAGRKTAGWLPHQRLTVSGAPKGSMRKYQVPLSLIGRRKKTSRPITIYCACWSCA
jgi:hypothetical protein